MLLGGSWTSPKVILLYAHPEPLRSIANSYPAYGYFIPFGV